MTLVTTYIKHDLSVVVAWILERPCQFKSFFLGLRTDCENGEQTDR